MSFGSPGEFFAMGGHGLYVWLSYGAALIIFGYNALAARNRQRRVILELRDRQRREDASRRAGAASSESGSPTGESVGS